MYSYTTIKKSVGKHFDKVFENMDDTFKSMDGVFKSMDEAFKAEEKESATSKDLTITEVNGRVIIEGKIKTLLVNGHLVDVTKLQQEG